MVTEQGGMVTEHRRWQFYVGPLVGSAAAALVWKLLEVIARYSLLSGIDRQAIPARMSSLGVRYVMALFVALFFAGLFGGMVGAYISRPQNRLMDMLIGALGPTLLAALCAMGYHFWRAPEMGASANLWMFPLAVCGAIGGCLAGVLLPNPSRKK